MSSTYRRISGVKSFPTPGIRLLGMATHKVLAIPPAMIDPKHRTIVSMGISIHAIASTES